MKRISHRRGSALLIVLGMLAFMVVSAVAFSAYMRSSRLPSSFLRRSVSSRMLVKAALAEAIDEIDSAIGNNAHPGVGNTHCRTGLGLNALGRNNWLGRIYLGQKGESTSLTPQDHMISPNETVSTLTLEGLAYLPPALVNEARYLGRRSNAAAWRQMSFDAGRYAFTAIDVSDHFDVNTLFANTPRLSMPGRRLSLAYLFENDAHTGADGALSASSWDDSFMKNFRDPGRIPLVSMADFNLALDVTGGGTGFASPFCRYVRGSTASFYAGANVTDPNGAMAERVRRMAFVTDSWQPVSASEADADTVTLEEVNADLRAAGIEDGSQKRLTDIRSALARPALKQLRKALNLYGAFALWDYLDLNRVPCSLSVPTTERVPMVCGIGFQAGGDSRLKIENKTAENVYEPADNTAADSSAPTRTRTLKKNYYLTPVGFDEKVKVRTACVYPFAHSDGVDDSFEVDGRVSFFLRAPSTGVGLRTASFGDALHLDSSSRTRIQRNPNVNVIDSPLRFGTISSRNLVQRFRSASAAEQETALVTPTLEATAGEFSSSERPFFTVTYRWNQTREKIGEGLYRYQPEEPDQSAEIVDLQFSMLPLGRDGCPDETWAAKLRNGNFDDAGVDLNVAVWVRVKYNDPDLGLKTVDLAPACLKDDKELNDLGMNDGDISAYQQYLGDCYPLLRFGTSLRVDFTPLKPQGAAPADPTVTGDISDLNDKSILVADPRFNHLPECWFMASDIQPQTWVNSCLAHESGRDGDILLTTSDQGCLQSVYELAHVQRFTDFYRDGEWDWWEGGVRHNFGLTEIPSAYDANNPGAIVAWKSYSPFKNQYGDDFEGLNLVSLDQGARVTPFTTSTNVVMAALANTPLEWRFAYSNNTDLAKAPWKMKASEFNKDHSYAWNEMNANETEKLAWKELAAFGGDFMYEIGEAFRGGASADWRDVWDGMGWNGWVNSAADAATRAQDLCGIQLQNASLWNADKKFLYGFWRECFAVRQQLFLVFVRAEPAMMGGGAAGQTPPQLGGRAVALVWRDPAATSDTKAPHRTRVLFYRQLD